MTLTPDQEAQIRATVESNYPRVRNLTEEQLLAEIETSANTAGLSAMAVGSTADNLLHEIGHVLCAHNVQTQVQSAVGSSDVLTIVSTVISIVGRMTILGAVICAVELLLRIGYPLFCERYAS